MFFKAYGQLIALAACAIAVVILWALWHNAAADLKVEESKTTRLQEEVKALQGDVKGWETTAGACSASVETLKQQADANRQQAEATLEAAKKATKTVTKTVIEYITEKRPIGVTPCENAERSINEELQSILSPAPDPASVSVRKPAANN